MRRILVTIFVLAIAASALAQTAKKPAQVTITNAPPGLNIDIFMDGGKVRTAVVDPEGTTNISLDFLSLGKPQGQVYIETCKDGQRLHIISDGTTVPAETGCDRKPVGVPFGFSCGKLTLNWSQLGIKVSGCGGSNTTKYVYGGGGAAALAGGLLLFGGGGTPTAPSVSTNLTQPVNQSSSVTTATPPTAQTPVATPTPTPAPAPTPAPTTIDPTGAYRILSCRVVSDPTSYENNMRLCSTLSQIDASASNGGVTFTGNATNFMRFGGAYNITTGAFSLSSTGAIGPTSGVAATLIGTVTGAGRFTARYDVGTNGILPGGARPLLEIEAQKQ